MLVHLSHDVIPVERAGIKAENSGNDQAPLTSGSFCPNPDTKSGEPL